MIANFIFMEYKQVDLLLVEQRNFYMINVSPGREVCVEQEEKVSILLILHESFVAEITNIIGFIHNWSIY